MLTFSDDKRFDPRAQPPPQRTWMHVARFNIGGINRREEMSEWSDVYYGRLGVTSSSISVQSIARTEGGNRTSLRGA